MTRQKLLENKRNGASICEKPKTETASNQAAEKIPVRQTQSFTVPFQLELAGNRWSPLHEW